MKGGSVPVAGGARIATAVVADFFPLVEHGLPPFVSRDHPPCQALPFGNLLIARPIAMPLDPVEHEEVGLLVQVRAKEPQPPYPCLVCLLLSKVLPCALRERQFYTGS